MKLLIILDTYLESGSMVELLNKINKNHNIQILYNNQINEVININILKSFNISIYKPITEITESDVESNNVVLIFSSIYQNYNNIKDNYYKKLFQISKNKQVFFFSNNLTHHKKYDNCSKFIYKSIFPTITEIEETISCISENYIPKKVIITAGATLSNLDPVRFVTNPARGGTSYLLAKKYLKEGYSVHVIKGQNCIPEFKFLNNLPQYSEETVSTTKDLLNSVINLKNKFDIYISPMAVSDIEFEYSDFKIKKSNMKNQFEFKQAPDVLKYVIENKTKTQQIVGFAAETDLNESTLFEKTNRKPVDLLVANLVNSGFNKKNKQGFGTKDGYYKFVSNNTIEDIGQLTKENLANVIFNKIN